MAVIDFFFMAHEPGLIVLAAAICLISSYACIGLLRHARRAGGHMRNVWTGVAAAAVGFGIWATHFVAVLAYRPGFTLHYDLGLTLLSMLVAIVVCGTGIAMAIRGENRRDQFLGGAVVGLAISSMHYIGMASLIMGGRLQWNPALVSLSILAGIVLGGLAFTTGMGGNIRRTLSGALLLTLAICAMHFTAMAAADFTLCFPLLADGELNGFWMSILLTVISLILLGLALGSSVLDEADRRRTQREQERELRDAAQILAVTQKLELAMTHMAQGLGLYGADGRLQLYNQRFPSLLGMDAANDLTGSSFRETCRRTIVAAGIVPELVDERVEATLATHGPLIAGGGEIVIPFAEDRVLQVSHSPVGDGSWVTTVDDITERHRSQRAIAHLARHDGLTGLPNRARYHESFELALEKAGEVRGKVAIIAIDLDHFKEINDNHGHAAGDLVLKTLASRFNAVLREGETVARLGGDEFAAIKVFASMDGLRDFLGRLEEALTRPVDNDGITIATGGSIGVAVWPDDGRDISKLMSNADLAMYRAKAEFDRRICYYERDMDEQARERRDMARDLWTAVENDGFHLAYQVQKSVATSEITGYEVLLRWNRPGYGEVSPADFIPVAEECGAINAIGVWVLKVACLEAASWPEPFKIAVNVSGLQLSQIELIATVRNTLLMSGLAPHRLELEVTETSIIGDKQRALHILRQIKALGVSIAIDDFGTGYSSLETLRAFPFDKIKLDRSFMSEVESNEQSKAIVRAILALGRSLSVPVLAEGVETSAQLDVLRKEGCTEAQGFLLGRPGAIDWSDRLELGMRA
ncbi:diguanylate cyclase (GGDEF) domain-containing protein [Devosia lucknowensis]|uniref:Diguanylate cyclase (GGDEF) domain-containing protein n=1 Tax=Devosia lucknowensis TaxID=1096929 RepID=A0A1Y6E5H5_9HYPH|nr:EAL domain-containing protein [Devosia lucknowensis]SMQ58014.1 diguanylate cyclase (GGDEF) domain-containing protein [Devosia lucknowensis]